MKTNFYFGILVALASVCACAKMEQDPGSGTGKQEVVTNFTINASADGAVRTALDGEDYITWTEGDAISVWEAGNPSNSNVQLSLAASSIGARKGAFSGSLTPAGTDFTLYAVYPYSASYGENPAEVALTVPSAVNQCANVNDVVGVSDFLIGSANLKSSDEEYAMSFKHPLTLLDIQIDGSNSVLCEATIASLTITANTAFVGDVTANLTDGTVVPSGDGGKSLTITFPSTAKMSTLQHAWVAILPADLTNAECCFDLKMTNGHEIKFNVNPSKAFEAQHIYPVIISDIDAKVDAGKANPVYFDLVGAYKGSGPNRANCYIVREGGYYKFAADRIDKSHCFEGDKPASGGYKADWLWATGTESKVDFVGLGNSGAVNFRVKAKANGNTIIAVVDPDKNIVWSWHVWCSVEDPMTPTTYSRNDSWNVSARNLGALSTEDGDPDTNLLYYQYGRKDPFPANTKNVVFNTSSKVFKSEDLKMSNVNSITDDAVAFAVANPTKFINNISNNSWVKGKTMAEVQTLWGAGDDLAKTKTIYDPCPAGYTTVINIDQGWYTYFVAKTADKNYGVTFNTKGITYVDPDGSSTYYPAAGYLNGLDDLKENGTNVRVWSATLKGTDKNIQGRMLYVTLPSTISNNTSRTYFALPVRCLKIIK